MTVSRRHRPVPPRSVLFVRLSSIGDVVHALPAWSDVRRRWPAARVGWVAERPAAGLLRHLPGTTLYELPPRWFFPQRWGEARRLLRRLRRDRYEVALDLQGLMKSALLARGSGARAVGLHPADLRERAAAWLYHACAPPAPPAAHMVQRGRLVLRALGAQPEGAAEFPPLAGEDDRQRVQRWLRELEVPRPFALLHAAANWKSKEYPADRWVDVGRALAGAGLTVLWVWGPGERDSIGQLAGRAGPGNRPAPATRLTELAALLERADLFVGGDSGPLHIAVACGTPAVALFGPTDPSRLGPLRATDEVVVRVLSCSHCHRRKCPLGTTACLLEIPAREIVEACLRRLADSPAVRTGPPPASPPPFAPR